MRNKLKPEIESELCKDVDEAICQFSMDFNHPFTEEELEEFVLRMVTMLKEKNWV